MLSAPEEVQARPRQMTAEAVALWARYPSRPVAGDWPGTRLGRAEIVRMLSQYTASRGIDRQGQLRRGLLKILSWLELQPGDSWQQRWRASGAEKDGRVDWRQNAVAQLCGAGLMRRDATMIPKTFGGTLAWMISADILRPRLNWLLVTDSPHSLMDPMAHARDRGGVAALQACTHRSAVSVSSRVAALEKIAVILAAKGGLVSEITVGDCMDLLAACCTEYPDTRSHHHSTLFYQLLHRAGMLNPGAPPTVRMFSPMFGGKLTPESLVDRYDLACRPVRDLLVAYLRERQPVLDYSSLRQLSAILALRFWKDLETHHPGIDSIRLHPDAAAAWKARVRTKSARASSADGNAAGQMVERMGADAVMLKVRAFYLDIAEWALEDPARWAPWAVTCPIRTGDLDHSKAKTRQKARTDTRTRDRLPKLPALVEALRTGHDAAARRLTAARHAEPGTGFTVDGRTWLRTGVRRETPYIWITDPRTGKRLDASLREERAFWAWAAVEVLRHTGIRIEELCELTHHSLVQYRLPGTGELIPLLQIAPSKTDQERLLVVSPELADVLSRIIMRIRDETGRIPLAAPYDAYEHQWLTPMPLLFQRTLGAEHRPIPIGNLRQLIHEGAATARITGAAGQPLVFTPHDFRRMFATDAILNGMPPHIAQLILGHRDINTTMGYAAVYPQEAINGHRSFIARRRAERPAEEYRTPTDEEWEEFLGHFQRRKVALGECGRAYGTSCIHEHSCVRCSLLRPDPAQRPRLLEIRDNLRQRIEEAEQQGWLGEAEGLKVSLAAATEKITQLEARAAKTVDLIHLGIPTLRHTPPKTRHSS